MNRAYYGAVSYLTIFITGAFTYGIIELTGRGRTHITMGLLGGAAMCLIHRLNSGSGGAAALFLKLCFSAFCITAAELASGVLLNIHLGMDIWDYSDMPYNLYGQICPAFSLIWFSLSGLAMLFDTFIRRQVLHEREIGADISSSHVPTQGTA